MKKVIIFLMTIIGANTFFLTNVSAKTYYEGDYIQGIWMTKEKNGTKYYQKARFFNEKYTNDFAYCIEPFEMFNESSTYVESNVAYSLTNDIIERLKLIAYFGYGYTNHEDIKWYAITQFMIWQTADPSGTYYFTDSLNGNRIDAYTSEINEINNLINNYNTLPSFNNSTINLIEDKSITLNDINGVLHNYSTNNSNIIINGDNLTITGLKEGNYDINLMRGENKYNRIPIFSHSDSSQDMLVAGDIDLKNSKLHVQVKQTKLELTKIDSDNKSTIPRGEASLVGSKYQLYDQNMNIVQELIIGENSKVILLNLDPGKYYLREIEPGEGYTLNDEIYEFEISFDNNIKELTVENKVIEKNIRLHKTLGDGISSGNEGNISFEIYDSNGNLFDTITTDTHGYASIVLPYGNYTFKQVNTTTGYMTVNDFTVEVADNIEKEIHLYDHKISTSKTNTYINNNYVISVPNTNKNKSYLSLLITFILGGIYAKKKILY